MFTVETNSSNGVYTKVYGTESADNAIHFFIAAVDKIRPKDSIRILRNGETMARKTPKGHFIHKEWK